MKRILKILAIIVGVLIVVLIALPFLIDVNAFRPRLESMLTDALGRQAKVGNLSLSLLSGGVKADDISIADDPEFSKTPFVQAKSLSVGVELIPLIFSKTLNVTNLTLNKPEISLVKSENGEKWNFSSLGSKTATPAAGSRPSTEAKPAPEAKKTEPKATGTENSSSGSNMSVSVQKLSVKDGRLIVSRAGSREKPRVYDKVDVDVSDLSLTSSFPFRVAAQLPGGGKMHLEGKAGPIAVNQAELTPGDAQVTVQGLNLAESGFIDPASGISGVADLNEKLTSDGHEARTNGKLKATGLKVAQKGSPAGRPVELTYAVVHNLVKQEGEITKCDIAMGKAVAHLTGSYNAHGAVTAVNLKLNGEGMPVDELEAMLPALGVVLPPRATLKGGDLNTNLVILGPVNKLVTTGTVRMENSALANFDLGSKLAAVSALAGKQTGNDTTIKNFSSDVRVAPEGTQANNINLTVPSIGELTGAGTVSPANELAFKMNASVGGMGVPFTISGKTSDPKFAPDVKGMATGFLKGALKNQQGQQQQNPLSGLSGLFKKKQK